MLIYRSFLFGLGLFVVSCAGVEEGKSQLNSHDLASRWANLQLFSVAGDIVPQILSIADQGKSNLNLTADTVRPEDLLSDDAVASLQLPDKPNKTATIEIGSKLESSISFGISGSVLNIVEASAQDNITFGIEVRKRLILIKHTPTASSEQMLTNANDGEVRPLVTEGLAYRGSCVYEASNQESLRWLGALKFMGSGGSATQGKSKSRSVSVASQFFDVLSTDSVASLTNICHELYAAKVKQGVDKDLALLIKSNHQVTKFAPTPEAIALRAAFYGPKVSRLELYGNHWDVYPAQVTADGAGSVRLDGKLVHTTRLQPDDPIYYKCATTPNGVKPFIQMQSNSLLSGWKKEVERFVNTICNEAYVEFFKFKRK